MVCTQHDMHEVCNTLNIKTTPPATGVAYLNLPVRTAPARVFSPVNPASITCSISIEITFFIDLYAYGLIEKNPLVIDGLKLSVIGKQIRLMASYFAFWILI